MKSLVLGFAGLSLLALQNDYELEQLTSTNGRSFTSDDFFTLELAATTHAGPTTDGTLCAILGPLAGRGGSTGIPIPDGVEILSVGDQNVIVSWDDVLARFPESSLDIMRSNNPATGFTSVGTVMSGHTFLDENVENGELYYYSLQMTTSVGKGQATKPLPALPTPNISGGDVDGDGDTDGADVVELAYRQNMVRQPGNPVWYPSADVNRDAAITDTDIEILKENLGNVSR